MEALMRDMKSLVKEAEVYHQQGLFEQSLEIYRRVFKCIEKDDRLSKNTDLREAVKDKIETVEKDRAEVNASSDTPELPEDVQDLIGKSNTSSLTGGLKYVNRSKRLKTIGHLKGGGASFPQIQLIYSSIFLFLLPNVFSDCLFISTHC